MTTAVIGEALVDLVWPTGTAHISPHPGGSPANVAVGLHRLGRQVTLMTSWGDDPPGELVSAYLDSTGVEVHRLPSASGRTTIALAYLDEATGSARYAFLAAWDPVEIPIPPQTTLVRTGSLAAVVEPGATPGRSPAWTRWPPVPHRNGRRRPGCPGPGCRPRHGRRSGSTSAGRGSG